MGVHIRSFDCSNSGGLWSGVNGSCDVLFFVCPPDPPLNMESTPLKV